MVLITKQKEDINYYQFFRQLILVFMMLAGLPAIKLFSVKQEQKTTLPKPTKLLSAMKTPGEIVVFDPINTLFPILISKFLPALVDKDP